VLACDPRGPGFVRPRLDVAPRIMAISANHGHFLPSDAGGLELHFKGFIETASQPYSALTGYSEELEIRNAIGDVSAACAACNARGVMPYNCWPAKAIFRRRFSSGPPDVAELAALPVALNAALTTLMRGPAHLSSIPAQPRLAPAGHPAGSLRRSLEKLARQGDLQSSVMTSMTQLHQWNRAH
jgi:hypothetical protein